MRHSAAAWRVAALGVNCGAEIRLPELLEIVTAYRSITDLPLFVRPSAGTPKEVGGQWVYPETPASMAAWLPALFEAGVVMVGGCCGTTPAHIAAFRTVVDEWNRAHGALSASATCLPFRARSIMRARNGKPVGEARSRDAAGETVNSGGDFSFKSCPISAE